MKKAALLAGACLSLAILITGPVSAQESTRYESWNGGAAGSTQDMVKALRDLVDEAEQVRAADPRFLDDLKALMRYNDYKNDPLSHNNPMDAICSRGDLLGGSHTTRSTDGCYDTKVSSWAAMQERGTLWAEAVNGPTRSGEKLPIFKWSDHVNTTVHVGQPDAFDFDFIQVQPRTFE